MTNWLIWVFGDGKDLEWWQMCSRSFLMFFVALALIRISGRRSFGMGSPFDNVITILLGAILSRAVVGASPVGGTIGACLVLVLLHRVIAWLCIRSEWANRVFKGTSIILFEDGVVQQKNLDKSLICETDLKEEVRMEGNMDTFDQVDKAILERSGRISITKKQ